MSIIRRGSRPYTRNQSALPCLAEPLTGCPVLVNTSFNVRGEPICCTPEDAFRCFMGGEMNVLVAGNCICKEDQDPALCSTLPATHRLKARRHSRRSRPADGRPFALRQIPLHRHPHGAVAFRRHRGLLYSGQPDFALLARHPDPRVRWPTLLSRFACRTCCAASPRVLSAPPSSDLPATWPIRQGVGARLCRGRAPCCWPHSSDFVFLLGEIFVVGDGRGRSPAFLASRTSGSRSTSPGSTSPTCSSSPS